MPFKLGYFSHIACLRGEGDKIHPCIRIETHIFILKQLFSVLKWICKLSFFIQPYSSVTLSSCTIQSWRICVDSWGIRRNQSLTWHDFTATLHGHFMAIVFEQRKLPTQIIQIHLITINYKDNIWIRDSWNCSLIQVHNNVQNQNKHGVPQSMMISNT